MESISRIFWERRGHVIVRQQLRSFSPLVTLPAASTSKRCAICFTTTSVRGSCMNLVLLSFAKSVRFCRRSWSSMHHPHLQPVHQPHPPTPAIQMMTTMISLFPNMAQSGPLRISLVTHRPRHLKGTTTEWENGSISATFLRWCCRMLRRGCSSKHRRSFKVKFDITSPRQMIWPGLMF